MKGGAEAIRRAEELLLDERRGWKTRSVPVAAVEEQMSRAVDQVMGEGGLYAPTLAALAVKQAAGDLMEAAFLLRAYRSTLPRVAYSIPCTTDEMFVLRRISSTYQYVPGGQLLGATGDYTPRLLDFTLMSETDEEPCDAAGEQEEEREETVEENGEIDPRRFPKVSSILREFSLLAAHGEEAEEEPYDITTESMAFPAPRSARMQALARGETGAMVALAYSSLRGYGFVHPTLAELRVGRLPLRLRHPHTGETVRVGEVDVTECEAVYGGFASVEAEESEGVNAFAFGYGLVFGRNERKAISMAVLDRSTSIDDGSAPACNQEFVFSHIDGVDSMGFVEHLKLPHYVTFQSAVDRLRRSREGEKVESGG